MRVTFVLPGAGPSGGVRVAATVANGLLERSHQVRLLIYRGEAGLRSMVRTTLTKLCYPRTSNWLSRFRGVKELFGDIRRCKFCDGEILVAVGLWCCREISRLSLDGIKKVHYIHGISPQEPELMRQAWSENVPKIGVSSYLVDEVRRVCGQKLFAVVPNGVDTGEYFPSVPENERDGVGTIYANAYHKDPATTLAALEELRKRCPAVPQRVFGPRRRPVRIPRSVYVQLPSVEQAREMYSRSRVWFMASCSEGFAVPVLEAMACGCVVVATDCGGPSDVITSGKNGFLVEVGDVKKIVDRIELLLRDDELRRKMVGNSLSTVHKFTWQNTIDKLEAALLAIAGA